jgi:small-conductance mechanosensitive channel
MYKAHLLLYLLATGTGGAFLLWWLHRRIQLVEVKKRERLERADLVNAVHTKSPVGDPNKKARSGALESVATRFSIIRRALIALVTILWLLALAFPFLGDLPATFVSVMVAAAAVVIGIAAKPFVENLISGVVISFSQPVRLGDTVMIDGNYGTVEDITMTHTRIKLWDWRRYTVPNSLMIQKEFHNYTIIDSYQWAYVEFWVAYDADLEQVREIAMEAVVSSPHFADYEPPRFWIMQMTEKSVKCWVAGWANSPAEAWLLMHETRTDLVKKLRSFGIKTHIYQYQLNGTPEDKAERSKM